MNMKTATDDTLEVVYYDSQSVSYLLKHLMFHSKPKHDDVRFHFIWHIVTQNLVLIDKIATEENLAYMSPKKYP